MGSVNCRVKAKFVINTPFRAARGLTSSVLFLGRLGPRVIKVNPFVPRRSARFTSRPTKALRLALCLLKLVHLVLPGILLPTAATLNAVSPAKERRKVLTKTGIIVPGLSPARIHGSCLLCSGGVYANSRSTRYGGYLTRGVRSIKCRIIMSQKSSLGGWGRIRNVQRVTFP